MEIFRYFMKYEEIWKCLCIAVWIVGVSKEKHRALRLDFYEVQKPVKPNLNFVLCDFYLNFHNVFGQPQNYAPLMWSMIQSYLHVAINHLTLNEYKDLALIVCFLHQ